jgi:hypothetical protein
MKIKYAVTRNYHPDNIVLSRGPNSVLVDNGVGKFWLVKCRKVASIVPTLPSDHLWQCHWATCVTVFGPHVTVILVHTWQCHWVTCGSDNWSLVAVSLGNMSQCEWVICGSGTGSHVAVNLGHIWQ